jgi:hypothetical protein
VSGCGEKYETPIAKDIVCGGGARNFIASLAKHLDVPDGTNKSSTLKAVSEIKRYVALERKGENTKGVGIWQHRSNH